jgi:tRNA nucleotidyltransferase (CCA-adding enzyme)
MLRKAAMQDLSAHLARPARDIAEALARRGHRAWIVGGAARDLTLGLHPVELDMASDARPEQVEEIFEHTFPVGRAFGTLVIHMRELDVQHTTFRSEHGYSDARRPDSVAYGKSIEEDSTRRDFTCNALYLDPLTDELRDPQHGIEDLRARRLACVGDPRGRFEEDGLRLLRMARFGAALDLVPTPEVLAAARAARDTLRGVSAERILSELRAIFGNPHAARALELLHACGLLDRAVPGLWASGMDVPTQTAAWQRLRRVFDRLPSPCGANLGLAALLAPETKSDRLRGDAAIDEDWNARLEIARSIRTSRAEQHRMLEIWEISGALARASVHAGRPRRSERIHWMQSPAFAEALALARAQADADGESTALLAELEAERDRLEDGDLHPAALITPEDLAAAGIPRGPRWGELLREIETLQLDRTLCTRDEALGWLSAARARDQDGGKTPRRR